MKFDTPDDLFRATVAHAIRERSKAELDAAYNAAHSFLLHPDAGTVEQVKDRIRAISEERLRRRSRWPVIISISALIVSGSAAIRLFLQRDQTHRIEALESGLQSVRVELLAHAHPAMTSPSTSPPPSSSEAPRKP